MKSNQKTDSYITLLRERVSSAPDKTAYVYDGCQYSWRDIDMASQIMAHDLSESGVRKGDRVGICSKNSINWIFAFYALQKLGAVAVLINYRLSPPEISALCDTAKVSFMCCDRAEKGQYPIGDGVDMTSRFAEYKKLSGLFFGTHDPQSPGIIVFTSGSTGKPKSVMSSPCECLNAVRFFETEFRLTDEDRNCAVLPFFHVFGLATGISLCLLGNYPSYIPSDSRPSTVLSLIEKYKCTVLETVPTVMLAMTELPDFTPDRLRSLRTTVMGGSSATPSQMKKLCDILPYDRFANVYGMSEIIAVSVTRYDDSLEHITSTVGTPLPGVEVEIRDTATGQGLDDGQTGEIYVHSDGWLKTGDLGYIDPDGYIHLCGRVKDVIIRGGENISPTEVADAVALLPAVADVRVFGVPHGILGEEVAAAVILKPGMTFDQNSRKLLESRIAKYKIPAYFAVVDKFPLLGSGKVDMTALRQQIVSGKLK